MTERLTRATVTFAHPFSLSDLDGLQRAGTYRIETIDVTLDALSFIGYRRVSTTIELPAVGIAGMGRQVVGIDPLELEAAIQKDRATQAGARTQKEGIDATA